MAKPVIDYKKCVACGTCVQVCPVEVYANEKDKVVVKKPDACVECRACEVSCPQEAIKVIP
ncbi:MAG: 4Fe-4S dicluster domain-containing protein [Candidatus Altiarchaeales archaeon]|nr:4Fe-4S dicluster domain-containing protein [Candidatus Altiarchaeales archaeon]